jgi:phosphoribosyl 1,2-cyclic phosphate phosphodiesterase
VPLFAEDHVQKVIRQSFSYAFENARPETHVGSRPQLVFQPLEENMTVDVLGAPVVSLRLQHGPHFQVLGFRFGDLAYCTDTNEITDSAWDRLQGLDTLVLDALRDRPHPTHFSLEEAVEIARQLKPRRTVFTHMSHELDYDTINARLPQGIELGYDGMELPLRM